MKRRSFFVAALFLLVMLIALPTQRATAQGWTWGRGSDSVGIDSWPVATDNFGNVYVAGYTFNSGPILFGSGIRLPYSSTSRCFWTKYNSAGTPLWTDGTVSGNVYIFNITTDPSGNLILFGSFFSGTMQIGSITLTNAYGGSGLTAQYFIAKVNPAGTVVWAVNDGQVNSSNQYVLGAQIFGAGGVTTDASGNIYVTSSFNKPTVSIGGTTYTNADGSGTTYDVFVAEYSPAGALVWARTFGGSDNDYGFGVAAASTGDVYVTGAYSSPTFTMGTATLANSYTHPLAYIAKFSSTGTPLWGQGAGGAQGAFGVGLAKDNAGNVYMTGGFGDPSISFGSTTVTRTYPSASPQLALYLVQYSPADVVTWSQTIGSATDGVWGYSIALSPCGQVWVSGSYSQNAVIGPGDTLKVPTGSIDPVFISGYDLTGGIIGYSGLSGGSDDQNGIACDPVGNVYLCADYQGASIAVGPDVVTHTYSYLETFYLGKYISVTTPPDTIFTNKDTALVCGSPLVIKGDTGYTIHQWSDGSTDSTLSVSVSGTYYVYNIACGKDIVIDTYHVKFFVDTSSARTNVSSCVSISSATLTSPIGYATYSWSTGATTSSITVTAAGSYLLYATDASACNVLADTFHFTILPDDSTFSQTSDSVCNTTGSTTLTAPLGYSTYLWNTGSTATSVSVGGTGTYWVYALTGCNLLTDTFHVTFMPIPAVNLGNDTQFCAGNTLALTSAEPSGYLYFWSTGSTSDSLPVTLSGIYSLTVTGTNGCSNSDNISINVLAAPVVQLGPPDTVICTNRVPLLQSYYSYTIAATYTWNTGAISSSITAPLPGIYWLQVSYADGCSGSDTINILNLADTLDFYQRDTAICKGQYLTALAIGTPGMTYQWLPTTGIANATTASAIIVPDTSATYTLTASISGCPPVVDSFHVDVQPIPDVVVGGNRFVCQFDTLHLLPTVSPGWYADYAYQWSPGAFLNDSATQYVVFVAGDSETIHLTVSTPAGCVGRDSAKIFVEPGNFVSFDTAIVMCPFDSVQFVPNSNDPGTTYRWHPALYIDDTTSAAPWVVPITSQKYWAIATSSHGCMDTLYASITVNPAANIDLGDTAVTIYPGQSYQILDLTNCVTFRWFPPEGLNEDVISSPVATPLVSTKYYVKATTQWGCSVIDSVSINVNTETVLALPNAFVPGNSGDPNSTFKVLKQGLASIHYFRIYNRWGNRVFETDDINVGWDGTYKGIPQPYDVYVYEIEAVTSTGQTFTKAGNVTLIR
jgi:gliding motility-associated-like protein